VPVVSCDSGGGGASCRVRELFCMHGPPTTVEGRLSHAHRPFPHVNQYTRIVDRTRSLRSGLVSRYCARGLYFLLKLYTYSSTAILPLTVKTYPISCTSLSWDEDPSPLPNMTYTLIYNKFITQKSLSSSSSSNISSLLVNFCFLRVFPNVADHVVFNCVTSPSRDFQDQLV
jgi:hypothetical protein